MKKYPTSGAANKRLLSCWACCLLLACFQEMFLFVFVLRRITVYFAIVLNRNQVKHGLKLQIFRGVFQGFIGGCESKSFHWVFQPTWRSHEYPKLHLQCPHVWKRGKKSQGYLQVIFGLEWKCMSFGVWQAANDFSSKPTSKGFLGSSEFLSIASILIQSSQLKIQATLETYWQSKCTNHLLFFSGLKIYPRFNKIRSKIPVCCGVFRYLFVC